MTAPHDTGGGPVFRPEPPVFLASLLLAGFMVVVIPAHLLDGNRTKALRVGLAAARVPLWRRPAVAALSRLSHPAAPTSIMMTRERARSGPSISHLEAVEIPLQN